MSYQRAVVNCRTCYETMIKNPSDDPIQTSSSLDARNQTMQSLEEELREAQIDYRHYEGGTFGIKKALDRIEKFQEALTACMNCEFKQAEIAEIFDPSDGSV